MMGHGQVPASTGDLPPRGRPDGKVPDGDVGRWRG
jgi:hypothetical protein